MTSKQLELQRREHQRRGCSAAERSFWLSDRCGKPKNQLQGGVPAAQTNPRTPV